MSSSLVESPSPFISVSELDLPSPVFFDESINTCQHRKLKYRGQPDFVSPVIRRQNRKRRTRRRQNRHGKGQRQKDNAPNNQHLLPGDYNAPNTETRTDIYDRNFEDLCALVQLPFFDNGTAMGQVVETSEDTPSVHAMPETDLPCE